MAAMADCERYDFAGLSVSIGHDTAETSSVRTLVMQPPILGTGHGPHPYLPSPLHAAIPHPFPVVNPETPLEQVA